RQIEGMRPAADIVHLLALNMHTADENGFRPLEVFRRRRADVFIDEADRPMRGDIGRDQQQALRRHEGLDPGGQRIGVFERSERGSVAWKDAQDPPHIVYAFNPHPLFLWDYPATAPCPSTTGQAVLQIPQHCGSYANPPRVQWLLRPVLGGLISRLTTSAARRNPAAGRYRLPADGRRRPARRGTASRRIQAPVSGRTDRGYRAHRGTRWTGNSA